MQRAGRTGQARSSPKSFVPEDDFFVIPLVDLRRDTFLTFDLHLPPINNGSPVLYRQRALTFSEEARCRLIETGVKELYVPAAQRTDYLRYMETNIRLALSDPSLTLDEKAQILYSTSCEMVRQFLEDPEQPDLVPRTRDLVGAAVEHLLAERNSFAAFLRTTSLDYRTYTHSVNVAMYTLHLAMRLGQTNPEMLEQIGIGTFLHDIGKSLVPAAILNKPGKLSAEEWDIMRKHSAWGHEILVAHGITSPVVLSITQDHHEKLDGSGYPAGLKADDLTDYVRMTTICDIFDALTTRRSYKDAVNSFSAFQIMKREMDGQLDPHFFDTFICMLHIDTHAPSSTE